MMTIEKFMSTETEVDIKWFNRHREKWMSDDQWICYLFLNQLYHGFHHISGEPKEHGSGIEINSREHRLATFDYNYLTRLVLISHEWGVRVNIVGSGPGMIKLILHKRHFREGSISKRHPTIEQAIKDFKG
ncbi:MAG: hypothetical protein ACPG47_02120 [Leucothrix sp.]